MQYPIPPPGFPPPNQPNPLNMFPVQHQMGPGAKTIVRRKFSADEDQLLINLVSKYGQNDWRSIAQHLQNRTARQCRERWKHYLSPEVSKTPWSKEDDDLLLQKYEELGSQWSMIANSFPGRTDIGVKNHFISLKHQREKDDKRATDRLITDIQHQNEFPGMVQTDHSMEVPVSLDQTLNIIPQMGDPLNSHLLQQTDMKNDNDPSLT